MNADVIVAHCFASVGGYYNYNYMISSSGGNSNNNMVNIKLINVIIYYFGTSAKEVKWAAALATTGVSLRCPLKAFAGLSLSVAYIFIYVILGTVAV